MNHHTNSDEQGELYMIVRDHKQLASIMIVQDVSQRELARAARWESHSYVARLLRGEAKTVKPDAALRIAHYLGVPVDMLFVTKVSGETGRSDRKLRTKSQ